MAARDVKEGGGQGGGGSAASGAQSRVMRELVSPDALVPERRDTCR